MDVEAKAEQEREALWAESVRRYRAKRGEQHRAAWYEYELRLYRIHSGLASEHLAQAEKLENDYYKEEGT